MYAFAWWWPDRTDPRLLRLDQQLVRRELPVQGRRREQLVMRADSSDPATVEDDDPVRVRDRREPVRDHKNRSVARRCA